MKVEIDLKTRTNREALSSIRRCLSIKEWDEQRKMDEIRRAINERDSYIEVGLHRVLGGGDVLTKERAFELTYQRPCEHQIQYPTRVAWEKMMKAMELYAESKVQEDRRNRTP